MSDLEASIFGLDANKEPGNDGVLHFFVKLCADGLKSPLLYTFPSKWQDSFLISIFKTGKRNDVGNYCCVAILSCFAEFFEVTVYDYIFFSVKSSIMSAQHGLFKGRATVTNLVKFISYVFNCMEKGVQVDAIYTDFPKAFDKVSHRLLLRKLAELADSVAAFLLR
jgi:hypothetical protein